MCELHCEKLHQMKRRTMEKCGEYYKVKGVRERRDIRYPRSEEKATGSFKETKQFG